MIYSVIAAKDGDVYHDSVEAGSQEEAETTAREQLAEAWHMQWALNNARSDGDGFVVDPVMPNYATERLYKAARKVNELLEDRRHLDLHADDRVMLEELQDAIHYFDAHGAKPVGDA